MLTKDDLREIKGLLIPLENKIDNMATDIKDLKLETKAIHVLIENQDKDFRHRIERLEDKVGVSPA